MFSPVLAGEGNNNPNRPHVCSQPIGPRQVTCQQWISTVARPDLRPGVASCCGDADTFIADNFEIVNGQLFAIITEDYTDETYPGFHIAKGDKVLIPPEKVNHLPEDAGNTSGHGVVFLGANGVVYCYFFPPLT